MASRQLFIVKRGDVEPGPEFVHAEYSMQCREQLKADPGILSLLQTFWDVTKKDVHGFIHRESYLDLMQRVAYAMISNTTPDMARELVARDWDSDVCGLDTMHYSTFVDALFEVCDLWCPYVDVREYVHFLTALQSMVMVPNTVDMDAVAEEDRPMLDGCLPRVLVPLADTVRWTNKSLPPALEDTYRNGLWLTGIHAMLKSDMKQLSFKAILCTVHTKVFGAFSQKIVATTKALTETAFQDYLRKYKHNTSSLKPLRPVERSSEGSRYRVHYLTNRLRQDEWDSELASVLHLLERRPGICVVGPPGCGKTRLATALAAELGLVYVSIPDVLDYVLKQPPPTAEEIFESDLLQLKAKVGKMLRAGQVVNREYSLDLVIDFISHNLQECQGYVLDAVFPHEVVPLSESNGMDLSVTHMLCLRGSQANVEHHVRGLAVDPKTRVVLSARDRAADTKGYAHAFVRSEVVVSVAPVEVVVPEEAEADEDTPPQDPDKAETDVLPPVDLTLPFRLPLYDLGQLDKYGPEKQRDRVLSLASIYLKLLVKGYQDFESGVSMTAQLIKTQLTVVDVLFHQSPQGVLQHAVHAITGAHPPLSRLSPSLSPVRVPIPPEVASKSREEQIRWLLYGDLVVAADVAHLLPVNEPRKLSVYRGYCPVLWADGEAVPGVPEFHAILAGRLYLLASKETQTEFLKHPQAVLRRLVSPKSPLPMYPTRPLPSRLWVVSTSSAWAPGLASYEEVVALLAATLHVDTLDPLSVLRAPSLDSLHTVVLRQGLTMSHAMVTQLVLDETVSRSDGFVLHDLPLDESTVAALDKNNTSLDLVLLLDPPRSSDAHETAHLAKLQKVLASVKAPTATVTMDPNAGAADNVAAIVRLLNPFDRNRIDGPDEGCLLDAPPLSAVEESARRQWGGTGPYCPVTFADTGRLHRVVPGKPEFVSFVDQAKYAMAGAKEKALFDRNPRQYLPKSAATTFRPVVWLHGVTGSGRRTLAAQLVAALGEEGTSILDLPRVAANFSKALILEAHATGVDNVEDSIQTQLYATALGTEISGQAPTGSALCLAPGIGPSRLPTRELLAICAEKRWLPFLILPLAIDEASIVARRMADWVYVAPPADEDEDPDEEPAAKKERKAAEAAAARDDEVARITAEVAAELEQFAAGLEAFGELGVQVAPPVDASRGSLRVLKTALTTLEATVLTRRHQLFCAPERLPVARLGPLVRAGYVDVGMHGPHCPVEADSVAVVDRPQAVLYRNRVYCPNSDNVATFLATPSAFVGRPSKPNKPVGSVAVVGPPRAGKTLIAKALARRFQWVYLGLDDVLQWIIACQRNTELHGLVLDYMTCADPVTFDVSAVPDAVLLQCIVVRIAAHDVQQAGFVLDGFPTTVRQAMLWEGLQRSEPSMPMSLLCLEASVTSIVRRCPDLPSGAFLKAMAQWHLHRLRLVVLYAHTYGVGYLKILDTNGMSTWKVVADAAALVAPIVSTAARYMQATASGKAAALNGLRFSQVYLDSHTNLRLGGICPVTLTTRNERHVSLLVDRRFLTEYEHVHYWLVDASALASFLEAPAKYLESRVLLQQTKTPVDMAMGCNLTTGAPMRLGFQGYCPVTFMDGAGPHDWAAIRKGSKFILAAYDNVIYAFDSVLAKSRFLRAPSVFAALTLPVKLPPLVDEAHSHLNVTMPGKLEQALSKLTEEALVTLGADRFKFPGVSLQASAVMFVALYLKSKKKATNQASQLPAEVAAMLQSYISDCRLGADIKEMTVPVGSAVKGVRSVRGKDGMDLGTKFARFDAIMASPKFHFQAYAKKGLDK
ncbi:hypothetical protein ACHHYP_10585 [Achlya hypogyna]|uniref:ATPase AAA-type core domain-containing protein n=1 Tax=Achlya hypogyna TaxID=1202772 RepID=A0A1V9YL16_ACHHY|nr:hypothetical protein ACHHYP_10585 [Achlya hypogyna]